MLEELTKQQIELDAVAARKTKTNWRNEWTKGSKDWKKKVK